MRRRENVCKNNDGVMRNRNRIDVKYVIFQKLVKIFWLDAGKEETRNCRKSLPVLTPRNSMRLIMNGCGGGMHCMAECDKEKATNEIS